MLSLRPPGVAHRFGKNRKCDQELPASGSGANADARPGDRQQTATVR
jgi:hypothetical protein